MFQNAFRNVTRERPPRPRLFGTGPFFDGAATPPLQGGEYARLNSGLVSIFLLQVTSATGHCSREQFRILSRLRDINTQIERFFRGCGISCGEAPLFSVSGFVADLLEAIPQSQSRVLGA